MPLTSGFPEAISEEPLHQNTGARQFCYSESIFAGSMLTTLQILRTKNHELLIAKFRLKLKEVGKTTRPFRYDLNQIPYDYTVEVTNRFKGLDLIDRVPEELWMEVCDTEQEAVIKTIPKKKK